MFIWYERVWGNIGRESGNERTHIVDCEDAFSCHRKNLLKVNCTIILSHDMGCVNKTDCGDSVLPADSRRDINMV